MKIGVLAMQGAYIEHINILKKLGIDAFEARYKKDFDELDGLIIPGGESSSIGKLIKILDIYPILKNKISNRLPVWGTCAGMILLAKSIENQEDNYICEMDIKVVRNGYGRQLGSFNTCSKMNHVGDDVNMVFIRAPFISSVGDNVEVLSVVDGKIVAAREDNILVTSFHPELTDDFRVHKYFIDMVKYK
ncbi:MAG: pyridoxal 5'-phosphate synthase glutaminase subunit PdxT [Romboutsia sp.]